MGTPNLGHGSAHDFNAASFSGTPPARFSARDLHQDLLKLKRPTPGTLTGQTIARLFSTFSAADGDQLNGRNIGFACTILGHAIKSGLESAEVVNDPEFRSGYRTFRRRVTELLGVQKFSGRDLAEIGRGIGVVGLPVPKLCEALLLTALRSRAEINGRDLPDMLWGLDRTAYRGPVVTAPFRELIVELVPKMNIVDCVRSCFSLARLRVRDQGLYELLVSRIEAQRPIGSIGSRDLRDLMTGLAIARTAISAANLAAAATLSSLVDPDSPQGSNSQNYVSRLARCLTWLGHIDDALFDRVGEFVERNRPHLNPVVIRELTEILQIHRERRLVRRNRST